MNNRLSLKNTLAIVIGNAFEWYDYFVYSFLSVYLAKLFFPATQQINSLLALFATFGVAFLMRPLGGIVLGMVADKFGRVRALNCSIALMVSALAVISFAPVYSQVGIIAPLLILFARLLQGFSAGGECGISAVLLFESAPAARRGLYCSFHTFSQMIAVQLSLVAGLLLASYLSVAQIESWGWRIPFLIGLLLIPIGMYIRHYLRDPIVPHQPQQSLLSMLRGHLQPLLIVVGLVSTGTVSMYVLLSYMPTYATVYLHLELMDAYSAILISVAMMTVFIPFFGWLSDKTGRKQLLLFSLLWCFIELYPCFFWLNTAPSFQRLVIVQCLLCFPLAIYYGAIQAAITELFAVQVRSTCLSLGVNSSVLLFGSFAPFFVTLLIKHYDNPLAVIIYPLIGIGLSLITVIFYQERKEIDAMVAIASIG